MDSYLPPCLNVSLAAGFAACSLFMVRRWWEPHWWFSVVLLFWGSALQSHWPSFVQHPALGSSFQQHSWHLAPYECVVKSICALRKTHLFYCPWILFPYVDYLTAITCHIFSWKWVDSYPVNIYFWIFYIQVYYGIQQMHKHCYWTQTLQRKQSYGKCHAQATLGAWAACEGCITDLLHACSRAASLSCWFDSCISLWAFVIN